MGVCVNTPIAGERVGPPVFFGVKGPEHLADLGFFRAATTPRAIANGSASVTAKSRRRPTTTAPATRPLVSSGVL